MSTPRNAACSCGSGVKFKKCCLRKETTLAVLMPVRDVATTETVVALRENIGLKNVLLTEVGKPVDEARNTLAARALSLDPAPDFILWVDADAWWPGGTLQRMIARFSNPAIDVLFGYFGGRDHYAPAFAWRRWNDLNSFPQPGRDCPLNAVEKVERAGFHFVLMRRAALERIGNLPFTPKPGWTEDFSCIARMLSAGLGLYVDTGAPIAHIGDDGRAHTVGMPSGKIVRNKLLLPPKPWLPPIGPRHLEPVRAYGLSAYGAP